MPKNARELVGDARARAAIEHLRVAVEALNAACRDLCSVSGAAPHYRAIARLSDGAAEQIRDIDLGHVRYASPFALNHEPDERERREPHYACVAKDGAS